MIAEVLILLRLRLRLRRKKLPEIKCSQRKKQEAAEAFLNLNLNLNLAILIFRIAEDYHLIFSKKYIMLITCQCTEISAFFRLTIMLLKYKEGTTAILIF